VVKGMTNKEIAQTLFISVNTVLTHRKNISRKLNIHSISGLTIYAIVNKIVKLDEVHLK
jgi:regulator of cell morphogenesis and NO signaling